MRSASSEDVPNSSAAAPTTAASVAAPAPSSSRIPNPSPKPTPNAPVPTVGVTALAVTSSRRSTVLGRAAPSPARMKRLTVSAASTRTYSPTSREPSKAPPLASTSPATPTASTTRTRLDSSSTRWRDHRSSSTPANGPTTVKGSTVADRAPATSGAVAVSVGLNRM